MSSAIDMTLDDLIKKNKQSNRSSSRGGGGGGGGGRARASGTGPTRRTFKRSANRAAPYSTSKVQAPEGAWQHDMFADHGAAFSPQVARPSSIETGTKLYISNLDYGVSNEDIKELFSEVGDMKRFGVHYDRSGRSKGTAEVVFTRRTDALAAVQRYNNVQLDGKPMKIEIVGTNLASAAAPPSAIKGNQNGAARSGQARGQAIGRSRGGGGGGRGARRGRGRGRGRGENVSADDLDADLEKYHAESMQTS